MTMPHLDTIGTIEYVILTVLIYIVNHPFLCILYVWLAVSFRVLTKIERRASAVLTHERLVVVARTRHGR